MSIFSSVALHSKHKVYLCAVMSVSSQISNRELLNVENGVYFPKRNPLLTVHMACLIFSRLFSMLSNTSTAA